MRVIDGALAALLLAPVVAPVVASAQSGFQLPSGNIHCAQFEGELRCDIANRSYPMPPGGRGCELEWGDSVVMTPRGAARLFCHGDTIRERSHPVLPYGTAWQGQGVSCTSSESGVRCVNQAGRGWEIARARLRLF